MNYCGDTYPFTFIVPEQISDSNLVSNNILEDEHPLYEAGTSYSVGDRVVVSSSYHKIYQALESSVGKFPPSNPLSWVEVGSTNAWSAFDNSGGTKTISSTPFIFEVFADRLDSIAFLGLIASSVRVEVSSVVDGVYYDETFQISDKGVVLNWYQYFFSKISFNSELFVNSIPPIGQSTYKITINPPTGGNLELETFIIGTTEEFGKTQYGASAGIVDYSRKEVDEFGVARLVKRRFSKRIDVQLWLEKAETDYLYTRLVNLRATPVLWIAARGQYETLTVFGFYRDFNIEITYPSVNFCTLQIEGLS